MKHKLIIVTFSLTLLFGCTQLNTDIQDSGSESAYPESVALAKNATTDTWVVLTGKITTHVGDNIYLFQDKTDEIRIKIDNAAWEGLSFNPSQQVSIKGKVIHAISGVRVDVSKIEAKTKQP